MPFVIAIGGFVASTIMNDDTPVPDPQVIEHIKESEESPFVFNPRDEIVKKILNEPSLLLPGDELHPIDEVATGGEGMVLEGPLSNGQYHVTIDRVEYSYRDLDGAPTVLVTWTLENLSREHPTITDYSMNLFQDDYPLPESVYSSEFGEPDGWLMNHHLIDTAPLGETITFKAGFTLMNDKDPIRLELSGPLDEPIPIHATYSLQQGS